MWRMSLISTGIRGNCSWKRTWQGDVAEGGEGRAKVAVHLGRDIPTLNKSLFEAGFGWLKDLVLYTASLLQFPSGNSQDISRRWLVYKDSKFSVSLLTSQNSSRNLEGMGNLVINSPCFLPEDLFFCPQRPSLSRPLNHDFPSVVGILLKTHMPECKIHHNPYTY